MRDRRLHELIWLATLMSLGHHIDHIIRGNHVGWPLQPEVTPFTYSLGVYPFISLGMYLDRATRAGPRYWALLTGAGAVFLTGIHFGPTAVESPDHIIHLYEPRILGWIAFAWLVAFIGVLTTTCLYALRVRTRM